MVKKKENTISENMLIDLEKNENIKDKKIQSINSEKEENVIGQIIQLPQQNNDSFPLTRDWINASTYQSLEYQKIFKSSQENFIKNTQILFMRYELFHLCLAELIYESKGKSTINSFTLGQISKIHEQLFKVGLKNLSNIFKHENYYENPYLKSNRTQKITDTSFETDYKTYLKTKKDVSKNINLKKKKKINL